MRRFPSLLSCIVATLCVLLLLPIVILAILSFSGENYLHFPPRIWSWRWYVRFFGNEAWQRALWTSLGVGLMGCVIASVLGFLGAYALVRGKLRRRRLIMAFVLLPIIVPQIITSIAIYFVSAPLHLVGSRVWIAICHAMLALPIVVVMLMAALQAVPMDLERAAFGLGATRAVVFRRVVIPLALPGVVSAALFAFLASFDELIVALFLSGISAETLPVHIWNALQMNLDPTVSAVSTVLIGVTIVVLLADWSVRRARVIRPRR